MMVGSDNDHNSLGDAEFNQTLDIEQQPYISRAVEAHLVETNIDSAGVINVEDGRDPEDIHERTS